jgi:HSP20 family molecular chaperone IbpA
MKMSEHAVAVQKAPENPAVKVVPAESLFDRINQIHENIARRAFEIFENDGGFFGHDVDNWLKAESELLHPVHMDVKDSDGHLVAKAEVPGFNANQLQVSLDDGRLTITGKKQITKEDKAKGKTVYEEHCSSELLRVIDLPAEVDAAKTTAILKNGVLELNMPKKAQTRNSRIEVKTA